MALSWIFIFNSSKRSRQQTWHNVHQGLTADRMCCCSPSLHVFSFVLSNSCVLSVYTSCVRLKKNQSEKEQKVPPHTQIAHWCVGCREAAHCVCRGFGMGIKWAPPPARQTGRVNVKTREKQNQSLPQQVLMTLSGMNNVNKKEFCFWLSAQRSLLWFLKIGPL